MMCVVLGIYIFLWLLIRLQLDLGGCPPSQLSITGVKDLVVLVLVISSVSLA
jgi:hypothetical protein